MNTSQRAAGVTRRRRSLGAPSPSRRWRALIVPAAVVAAAVAAAPAQANLSGVSRNANGTVAVDLNTGFPRWYMDNTGTKLKACVDSDNCLGGNPLPDPAAP